MPFGGYNPLDDGEYEDFSPWGPRREPLITEKRLHEIIDRAGFRVDGDEVLSCYREGVDISDDVMALIKLVAEECINQVGYFEYGNDGEAKEMAMDVLKSYFGLG